VTKTFSKAVHLKQMLFFWTFYSSRILKKVCYSFQKKKKINTDDNQLRIISEGSCDTEDWNNDAEKQLWHHMNIIHILKQKYIQHWCA